MKPEKLTDWLIGTAISGELAVLTQALALAELENVEADKTLDGKLQEIDWQKLLLAGSILARSRERRAVEASLRVATASLSLQESSRVKDAGSLLLQKLSNYRSMELADNRGLV